MRQVLKRYTYQAYATALSGPATMLPGLPDLPGDPVKLSYDVADLMVLDQPARQALLTEADALSRLTAEHALLTREITLTRALGSCPVPDFRHSYPSHN